MASETAELLWLVLRGTTCSNDNMGLFIWAWVFGKITECCDEFPVCGIGLKDCIPPHPAELERRKFDAHNDPEVSWTLPQGNE
ncbi:hypothetical protein HYALB_00005037 [Hymenoscyphus albidus]|uniref:Uncharacterized protein n=1 Tax=Hymenoscyphus albidus TaxID=595503 RepID=A0A9N9LHD3_9HELO|nr:hypothetical protein HYALB_00005037 [Hymenoscyphus albidus]